MHRCKWVTEMRKFEVYQVGKLPPLTVIECDGWYIIEDCGVPLLTFKKGKVVSAQFNLNNVAGLKEMEGE